MSAETKNWNPDDKVDFTYPEGYQAALEALDMLPEDSRDAIFSTFIRIVMMN